MGNIKIKKRNVYLSKIQCFPIRFEVKRDERERFDKS